MKTTLTLISPETAHAHHRTAVGEAMTDKPPILWRWKGSVGHFQKGHVFQEQREMINIDGFWYIKSEIDIKGYEGVTG
jgi:hypothetical protein